MKLTLQYFDSCPNWKITDSNVKAIVEEHELDADLECQLIETLEAAKEHRFPGSPTLLIDGRDPFATEPMSIGLACRIYETEAGPAGSPSMEQLSRALGV